MTAERSVILVATDGSDPAKAAVRAALELAAASGDRLVVVSVWNELRGDFGMPLHEVFPELVDAERDRAKDVLAAAAAEAESAGVEAETLIRQGEAAGEICAAASELRPRMVVVGSHGWGLIERTVFGSVSSDVMHHAPCPVLVVPDPGTVARRGGGRRKAAARAKEGAVT